MQDETRCHVLLFLGRREQASAYPTKGAEKELTKRNKEGKGRAWPFVEMVEEKMSCRLKESIARGRHT